MVHSEENEDAPRTCPMLKSPDTSQGAGETTGRPPLLRGIFGGVLMGLANLVPGISGGTMLLAAGVYPQFIDGVAEVTTFRWRWRTISLLLCVATAAILAILILAGPIKELVVHHRWIMYSLFIGLTLGGVPIIWRLVRKHTTGMWIGAVAGLLGMVGLAVVQMGSNASADRTGFVFMFIAGVAGASAMILPGVSGGYLLLVLGVYVPILAAISDLKSALPGVGTFQGDVIWNIGWTVILPVGLGVIIGIAAVSNLLRWLLHRYEKPTLGVLLGLLIGAVVGIWPFQEGIPPAVGDILKGQQVKLNEFDALVYAETGRAVEPEDWRVEYFTPVWGQVGGAIVLIAAGMAVSTVVARIGDHRK